MDIMEEIKFPSKDSEWIQKVLIGGIVAIIPIVNLIAGGYFLKVMKGAMDAKPVMPKWDDWGNLFMNGLIAAIIGLIYMIIPILILLVSAGSIIAAVVSAISGNTEMMFAAMAGAFGGILIAGLLALIFGFLLPMALSMYVRENSFGAALRFGEVISRIKSVFGDYLTVFVILIVLYFVLGVLSAIPFIGFLIMIFGSFYAGAVAYNMFGEVCARSKA